MISEEKDAITLKMETYHSGSNSVLIVFCQGSNQQFPLPNSHKQQNGLYDINAGQFFMDQLQVVMGSGS